MTIKSGFKTIKHFLPAILWGCIVIVLSMIPGGIELRTSFFEKYMLDKIGHAVFYGIWSFFIAFGFQLNQRRKVTWKEAFFSFFFAALFGCILEILQATVAVGRTFEILDIVSNIFGSLLGVLMLSILTKKTGYALNKF